MNAYRPQSRSVTARNCAGRPLRSDTRIAAGAAAATGESKDRGGDKRVKSRLAAAIIERQLSMKPFKQNAELGFDRGVMSENMTAPIESDGGLRNMVEAVDRAEQSREPELARQGRSVAQRTP